MSNNTFFELIDFIYDHQKTHKTKDEFNKDLDIVAIQFNKRLLNNFQKIFLIVIDHERAMQEYKKRLVSEEENETQSSQFSDDKQTEKKLSSTLKMIGSKIKRKKAEMPEPIEPIQFKV